MGNAFSLVLRFYKNQLNHAIEIVIEKIKIDLDEGFCADHLYACLKYFEYIEFYMEKEFNVMDSINTDKNLFLE